MLFPVVVVATGWLAWTIANHWLAAAALSLWPAAAIAIVAERGLAFRGARPTRNDVITDIAHLAISQTAGGTVAGLAVAGIATVSAAELAVWPTAAPVIVQLAIALLCAELVQYSWHRACHRWALLWRFHAIHHSTPTLYWLAGARFHPIEVVCVQATSFAPLALLGAPAEVVAVAVAITGVIGILQHADIELHLGPLNWLVCGPEIHRNHHELDADSQSTNFGTAVMVWDLVFGTWRPPHPPRSYGIDTPLLASYRAHLRAPFRARSSELTAAAGPRNRADHR